MSYVGNTPTQQAFTPAVDYFSGNGANTAFTLSRPVASVAQVEVIVNNVAQNPSTAYTINGNTITFTGAPSAGTNNIYVRYTSPITQVIQPGQASVGTLQLVDAAVTTAKIADANITAAKLAAGQVLSLNGVAFPATQVPSADANTLDDYEEGTFTPTISASTSGSVTYNSQSGKYTKIGNVVSVMIEVNFNKNTAVGNLSLGGLPFANNSSVTCRGISFDWFQPGGTAMITTHAILATNATSMNLYGLTAANADGTGRAWAASDISTQGYCQMVFTYLT